MINKSQNNIMKICQKGGFLKLIILIVVVVIIVVLFLLIKGGGGDDIVMVDQNSDELVPGGDKPATTADNANKINTNNSNTTAGTWSNSIASSTTSNSEDLSGSVVSGDFFTIVLPKGWSIGKDINTDGTFSGRIKGGSRLIEYDYGRNVVFPIEATKGAYTIMLEKIGTFDATLYKPKTGLGNLTGAYVSGLAKGNFTINAMHLAGPERDKILNIIRTIKFN